MIVVESMREALDVLNDVEVVYWAMRHHKGIDFTRELGEALGLVE